MREIMKNSISKLLIMLIMIIPLVLLGCESDQGYNSSETESSDINKIVTTYRPATDLVLALGGADKLIGVEDGASGGLDLIKSLKGESISELVEVGSKKNGINIEAVLSLDPDLVIIYPTEEDDETVEKLEAQNIKVVSINPESVDLLKDEIINVGKAMGVEEKANELVKYYNDKIKYVQETVNSLEKKKIYIAGSRGVLSTVSSSMYQHEMIEVAGGINVAADLKGGSNDVTVEQLLTWNPDVIFSVMYSEGGSHEDIKSDEKIKSINAIKNNDVYQIPSNISSWDMPQPSSILGILWIGKTLYPEEFSDLDIDKEANEFYSKFYGKSFEDLGGKLESE
ncbi:ABC transporter substrate-binding protein [Clostridium sp. D2Q-14]|uniref:ABC transporter substrate-binding protein n=1 Tax=Anaeromonas gelatinilytica TaxID=2683194 RepID=UPI00193B359B|nr:ABC transporter substrate-binding protein [Anaeromonas gelatinilytica]MBS4536711.1 ABC transporter substrate-binding protein [Anaeromonas gelatinilytica]